MTLALALTDNADGTGLVATVSGSSVGATNQLYVANHYNGYLSAAWTLAGSRTSDGTIAAALTVGSYWLYLVSTLAAAVNVTQVKAIRVTDGTGSIYYRVLLGVQSRLQSLSLAGISSADIKLQKFPWKRAADATTGIYVSPTRENGAGGFNAIDDIDYGAQVTFVQKSNDNLTSNISGELSWRQTARKAFDVTPTVNASTILAGVPEAWEVEVEPGPVFDYGSFTNNLDVNAFIVRARCRERRGN